MAAPPGGQFTYQGRRSAVRNVRRSTHDGAVAFRGQYITLRCDMVTLYILKNSSQNKKAPTGEELGLHVVAQYKSSRET